MNVNNGNYAWIAKVSDKGQIVIPKEAREMLNIMPGDEVLVFGNAERGLAILPKNTQDRYVSWILSETLENYSSKTVE